MSIPKWREVDYTDDGCAIWECLSCYEQWEGRTGPQRWAYCPYCGCKWTGEIKVDWDAASARRDRRFARKMGERSRTERVYPAVFTIERTMTSEKDSSDVLPQYSEVSIEWEDRDPYFIARQIRQMRRDEKENTEECDLGIYFHYRVIVKGNR
jgi:hypothetical protein